jgi:hypothetical protein
MKLNSPEFEGVIYGLEDLPYRKIAKLFKNAFEQCDYEFLEDKPAGAMVVSGTKELLLSDEDRVAIFDLVCDLMNDDGTGLILERVWKEDGTVRLTQYNFTRQGWESSELKTA